MQIVIDIDENLYTRLFDNRDIDAVDMLKACVAIRKGTPLPKEHGRSIDADTENEPQEISDRNLKMWVEIFAEERRRESEDKE